MSPLYAFDGASPFDLTAAKTAGGILCTTYIRGNPGGFNHADAARVAAIRAAGMGASPNWESTADFFGTCSVAQAQWAGVEAVAACRALGYPDNGTIRCSFSFDFDVPTTRFWEMGAKARAITTGLGGHYGTMLYAQQGLIDYLVAHGHVTGKHWLMMSTFGQPYTPRSPNVCMVQGHDLDGNWIQTHAITGTDINTVTDPAAVGAWWPTGSPYAQGAPDMPTTDADAAVVWNHTIDNRTAAYRLEAANQGIADLKAAVVTLAAAVAKLQAGAAPVTMVPTGQITLTPKVGA